MCVLMHIIKSDISVKEKLGIYIELQEFIFLLHNNGAEKLNPKKNSCQTSSNHLSILRLSTRGWSDVCANGSRGL